MSKNLFEVTFKMGALCYYDKAMQWLTFFYLFVLLFTYEIKLIGIYLY